MKSYMAISGAGIEMNYVIGLEITVVIPGAAVTVPGMKLEGP